MGGTTSAYVYDGDGKRASQTVGGTTTSYVYDVNTSLPNVLTDGTLTYVYGLGLTYAVDSSGNVQVYHTDGLGSVRALTDANGDVTQTYQTDEFGVPTQTQGGITQPFQYTGQQRDASTGLYYLRARMYDPTIGRFLSRDPLTGPLTYPLSFNRFAYALPDPVGFVDPSGYVIARALKDLGATDSDCFITSDGIARGLGVSAACLNLGAYFQVPVVIQTSSGPVLITWLLAMSNLPGGGSGSGSRTPSKTDRLKEHLTRSDLVAAMKELAGQIVKLKPSGVPFNHLQEVRDAQQGLLNRIDQIKNRLSYAGLSDDERVALTEELGLASRLLDYSEQFVPR